MLRCAATYPLIPVQDRFVLAPSPWGERYLFIDRDVASGFQHFQTLVRMRPGVSLCW